MSDPTIKLLGQMQGQIEALAASEKSINGWNAFMPPWVYASATTFTIAGADYTALFPTGTKIRLTQSGAIKYFYAIGASFGGGNTTITVTGGSDYSLANAAISSQFTSYASPAPGFPEWFNWTPTLTGWSANPTNTAYRFRIQGKLCCAFIRQGTAGTSNSTSTILTAPVVAATVSNGLWSAAGAGTDNGVNLTSGVLLTIASGSSDINCFKDMSGAIWTNPGNKRISGATLFYELP